MHGNGQRSAPAAPPLLEMRGIHKRFGAVSVLEDVDLTVQAGELHVLAGENGAGKSTLMKILGGVHRADAGTLCLSGVEHRFASRAESLAAGVAMIHQELALLDDLSVEDNLLLGREPGRGGWRDRRATRRRAREALALVELEVDPATRLGDLPLARKQMVEIARALSQDARVLVLDEPTSALGEGEAEVLFARLQEWQARGVGVIYISHRMQEIHRLADRITVLRDGRVVASRPAAELPAAALVEAMIGRRLDQYFPPARAGGGGAGLSVQDLTVTAGGAGGRALLEDVSFHLDQGQVLGIAGLEGSGKGLLLRALVGATAGRIQGTVQVGGRSLVARTPAQALAAGLAYVPRDRQREGLLLPRPVRENLTLSTLGRFLRHGLVHGAAERDAAARDIQDFAIRLGSMEQPAGTLSGGNQQKVLLARAVASRPTVLLLDDPTRGVDVGAKHEIHTLVRQWTAAGVAILLVSSELEELLGLADRVLVLHRGRVTALLQGEAMTAAAVMHAAMGAAA